MPSRFRARSPFAGARHAGAAAVLSIAAAASQALAGECLLVQERGTPAPKPHLVLHFGDPADVPARIQCATGVDKNQASFCVPVYAYNLWEGASEFEFSIRTPQPPLGFDRGPLVTGVEMSFEAVPEGTRTSLRLTSGTPICGPASLGCLRLPSGTLPDAFGIELGPNRGTGRLAARSGAGDWRDLAVRREGARVGIAVACPDDACERLAPIRDLQLANGERPGLIDIGWRSGGGSFTLLRYRTDGRYPADPWDGRFLAFLPSNVERLSQFVDFSGEMRLAAWSVTRGPYGQLLAVSTMECGSVAAQQIHLPVGVQHTRWDRVKSLYR